MNIKKITVQPTARNKKSLEGEDSEVNLQKKRGEIKKETQS